VLESPVGDRQTVKRTQGSQMIEMNSNGKNENVGHQKGWEDVKRNVSGEASAKACRWPGG